MGCGCGGKVKPRKAALAGQPRPGVTAENLARAREKMGLPPKPQA